MAVETFQDNEILEIWTDVFNVEEYPLRIVEIQANYPQDRSLVVSYHDIDQINPDFAMYLLEKPDRCLRLGKKAIKNQLPPTWEPSNEINLRITDLPRDAHVEVRNLRSKHLGRFVAIEGLVRKATIPKLKMTKAHYKCAKCDADIWQDQKGVYATEPLMCPNEGCNKTALRFILDEETSLYSDTQKVEIQENPEGLRGGAQPERITAFIEDDISGKITAGNRVTLNGIIRPVEKSDRDKSIVFDVFIDVNSVEFSQMEYEEIEITEEDEKKIIEASKDPAFFNKLVKSIAPTIYGMEKEKAGLALQLFGGCHKKMGKTEIRGDIHVLMVGDPGVAKSQLLNYMSRLAPRGIYASGKSASAAGLCIGGDSILTNDRGETETIRDFVESRMTEPEEYKPGIWRQAVDGGKTQSISELGSVRYLPVTYVWKIKTPEKIYKITAGGSSILITPETKLQAMQGSRFDWIEARDLRVGDMVSMVTKNMRMIMVTEIEVLTEDLPDYVYDLTIEPSHAFIASGFVVHNTAAAVKDDFGDGRWTLEAGALVLADKGLACIDELDKMSEQDRSSLHEAMEQQKISIAKAGISATLQSRCSLAAAANPKYGRFNREEKIASQIDLPPALMSRFDLIFPLFDVPDRERDMRLTEYILNTHRRGQAMMMKSDHIEGIDRDEILRETSDLSAIYDEEFIRKYVSYAKRNCFPVMGADAMRMIEMDYLNIRRLGDGEGAPVPITPRQLEAYVRLSEASAKSRLSDVVTDVDAGIAIDLINYYINNIARTSDGKLDFDQFGNDFSQKDRKNIKFYNDAIKNTIIKESPMGVTVQEIIDKNPDIPENTVKGVVETLSKAAQIIQVPGSNRWRWID